MGKDLSAQPTDASDLIGFQQIEEYFPLKGFGVRHVDENTLLDDERQSAMYELCSLCIATVPNFPEIIHQLRYLHDCGAKPEVVKSAICAFIAFEVAGSPKNSNQQTLDKWLQILTYNIIAQWLNLNIHDYQVAVQHGYDLRDSCKSEVAYLDLVRDTDLRNSLVQRVLFNHHFPVINAK
jgi:hypothetical protein